jgi:hypothetical protein
MGKNIQNITIIGGTTKSGQKEPIRKLEISTGDILALVGPTGSRACFFQTSSSWLPATRFRAGPSC